MWKMFHRNDKHNTSSLVGTNFSSNSACSAGNDTKSQQLIDSWTAGAGLPILRFVITEKVKVKHLEFCFFCQENLMMNSMMKWENPYQRGFEYCSTSIAKKYTAQYIITEMEQLMGL